MSAGSHRGTHMREPEGSARLTRSILDRCMQHGFAAAGICVARPSAHAAKYHAWIAAGSQGQMNYLATDIQDRLDPASLEPGAQSVICVADRYATGARDELIPGRGRIARYARGEDYHAIIRTRLEALVVELRAAHKQHRFRICVDTAPVLEREHSARAGLGRIGKHTLLIGPPGLGSWLALGTIVTTLKLAQGTRVAGQAQVSTGANAQTGADATVDAEPAEPAESTEPGEPAGPADPCGSCTRCIDACPTRAITPWSVDAARCISYVTIEHRGVVDRELAARVQDWIFGCDICQEVCPHNQPTRRSRSANAHPAYAPHTKSLDLLTILGWTEAHWEEARFHGALRRASRTMWVRNGALAAGCALKGEPHSTPLTQERAASLRAALEHLMHDAAEPPEIRSAAQVALEQ